MKNFKLKYDKKNYSKAFQLYRKQWIEKNLGRGVAIIIALLLISSIIKFIKKVKRRHLRHECKKGMMKLQQSFHFQQMP